MVNLIPDKWHWNCKMANNCTTTIKISKMYSTKKWRLEKVNDDPTDYRRRHFNYSNRIPLSICTDIMEELITMGKFNLET